jgi:hypothetical protein
MITVNLLILQFSQFSRCLPPLHPNTLSTVSNILYLCSYLRVRDQCKIHYRRKCLIFTEEADIFKDFNSRVDRPHMRLSEQLVLSWQTRLSTLRCRPIGWSARIRETRAFPHSPTKTVPLLLLTLNSNHNNSSNNNDVKYSLKDTYWESEN